MKYQEKSKITISEDSLDIPKQVRFSEDWEEIDLTSFTKVVTIIEEFSIGTHTINLNGVVGQLLIVKPAADILISINGADDLSLMEDKLSKIWSKVSITSLAITVSGNPAKVTLAVAGT